MSSPRPTSDNVSPTPLRERKSKKRKQKKEDEVKNPSGVNGSASGQDPDVTFGEDFLAFGPPDDSEVDPEPVERRKDKGKGTSV